MKRIHKNAATRRAILNVVEHHRGTWLGVMEKIGNRANFKIPMGPP